MDKVLVRNIRLSDYEDFMSLNHEFNGIEISKDSFASLILREDEIVLVAEFENKLVAFACAQVFVSVCYPTDQMELTEIFVDRAFRGSGIGSALVRRLERIGRERGVKEIRLETSSVNELAQKLYEKNEYLIKNRYVYCKSLELNGHS